MCLLALVAASIVTFAAASVVLTNEQKLTVIEQIKIFKKRVVDLAESAGFTNCKIKGNISINSGERIFHMPGQDDYRRTRIDTRYGERWFCTEEQAREAGWRKARN